MSSIARILSVDLGNYNTKTSNKIIFESRFKETDEVATGDEDIIEYDGRRYFMEQGQWDLDFNKVNKNYLPCLFYSVVKSFPKYNNINNLGLVLGLPLSQLKNKDKLKESLEGNTFNFKYKGKDKIISISKVGIIGEGFSSIYTLSESERNEPILLVDIGGGTINVVEYLNGKVQRTKTLKYGMYRFYEDIWKVALSETRVEIEDVRGLLESGRINDDIRAAEVKAKREFVERLQNDLKVFDPEFKEVFFTGGGAMTLKDELREQYQDCKFTNDLLFSNVLGNKILADALWGDEE